MSLENLLKIGQLKRHDTDGDEIGRLLDAVRRNIADAKVEAISIETRFDAAYKAVMQLSLAALMANGYRPDTNRPGHHMTVLQSLPKTVGLAGERMTVLDALRRKRNLSDYTGEDIDEAAMQHCLAEAGQLLKDVEAWLRDNRSDLV
ncbi:MAG: DNA-binding protein [Gammaproteobacteria bacterium]|nr:DNA-binding protein [Gammaproteobacteria bacterium]